MKKIVLIIFILISVAIYFSYFFEKKDINSIDRSNIEIQKLKKRVGHKKILIEDAEEMPIEKIKREREEDLDREKNEEEIKIKEEAKNIEEKINKFKITKENIDQIVQEYLF